MNNRLSNIELLRMIAMFAIILGHFWGHGLQSVDEIAGTKEADILSFLTSFLTCHVNLFLLITGYFGIKFRWKGIISLTIKILFYSLTIYFGYLLITGNKFTFDAFIRRFLFFCRMSPWWFIESYIYLYLFSPLINRVIEPLNKTQYQKVLVLLLFINVIIGGLFRSQQIGVTGFCFQHFALMYCIGGYIRRFGLFSKQSNFTLIAIWFFGSICQYILEDYWPWRGYVNPLVILTAISVFVLFSRIKLKSHTINWIAAGSFAVYLLHDEDTILRHCYVELMKQIYYLNNTIWVYASLAFVTAIVWFTVAILIDHVVMHFLSPIESLLINNDLIKYVNKKINQYAKE